jgi:uncharacterized protein (DUF433 family)
MKFREYIVRDPSIKNGEPILKGTQVTLKVVLGHLALGDSVENIVKTYPELTPESVRAVIAYAAAAAEVDLPGGYDAKLIPKIKGMYVSIETADVYARQGLYTEAQKIYRIILESEPDNAEVKKKISEIEKWLKPKDQKS